jgi:hypothetical protein
MMASIAWRVAAAMSPHGRVRSQKSCNPLSRVVPEQDCSLAARTDEAMIRSMPLYTHLDRIEQGLAAQGTGAAERLPPERLFALDQ